MRLRNQKPGPGMPQSMFVTRSQSWREAGLADQIAPAATKRARWEAPVVLVLFAVIVLLFDRRGELLGSALQEPGLEDVVRAATVIALMVLGWAIARDLGRVFGPALLRRMDPATAGTVGFLIRLGTVALALLIALDVAGVEPRTLLVGGAFTAVVFGIAAQQTLGNLVAGMVLFSARPFRVGDRVRLQGGVLGGGKGQIEGVVSSQGLLYTTLVAGGESVMVPNSVVLAVSVRPVREAEAVAMRARLAPGMTPGQMQELLEAALKTPLRRSPSITLEELEDGRAVVEIRATPQRAADGRKLAGELLAAVAETTGEAQSAAGEPAPAPEPAAKG